MGPTIILDKSTLQSLSSKEVRFLTTHFSLVIPPVLITEILADLKKEDSRGKNSPIEAVKILADKIANSEPIINIWYVDICLSALLGKYTPMTGVPYIQGENRVTEDGEEFWYSDATQESKAIHAWRSGNFSEAEHALAKRWRQANKEINLEKFKRKYQKSNLPDFKSLREIRDYLMGLYKSNAKNSQFQKECILELVEYLQVDKFLVRKIMYRWQKEGMPFFGYFARYAFYCFHLNQVFKLGIISGLIKTSTKAKTHIDMEYLYYLPFSLVFSSNDNFHKDIWPILLNNTQSFIDGNDLKADLASIATEWEALTEDQKKDRRVNFGSYPPENPSSIVHQTWQKLIEKRVIKPRGPKSGNIVEDLTEDEQRQIVEQVVGKVKKSKKVPKNS